MSILPEYTNAYSPACPAALVYACQLSVSCLYMIVVCVMIVGRETGNGARILKMLAFYRSAATYTLSIAKAGVCFLPFICSWNGGVSIVSVTLGRLSVTQTMEITEPTIRGFAEMAFRLFPEQCRQLYCGHVGNSPVSAFRKSRSFRNTDLLFQDSRCALALQIRRCGLLTCTTGSGLSRILPAAP